MSSIQDEEWMISVDDHLIEPPTVWTDRLPAKHRDQGPRWIKDEVGEYWLFDGQRTAIGSAVTGGAWPVGKRPYIFRPLNWDEIPASCYDPAARIEAMNMDRVGAALMFPNLPGFAGEVFQAVKDRELALVCIQAYNDWLLDEWYAPYPDRFIGMALIPFWDGQLAAKEAERALAKGARAVGFSLAPQQLGFPSIHDHGGYWDPLFSVMNEANLPICSHLGTGNPVRVSRIDVDALAAKIKSDADATDIIGQIKAGGNLQKIAADKHGKDVKSEGDEPVRYSDHLRVHAIMSQFAAQAPMLEWLFSGNFDRFPNLKIVLSENGIGWMPALLASADWIVEMGRSRITQPNDAENDPLFTKQAQELAEKTMLARAFHDSKSRMPSEIFREHVYGCFIHDPVGLRLLDIIGEDNVMIETDFPHNATWFPHSMEKVQDSIGGLSPETRAKILRGNAERVFKFKAKRPDQVELPVEFAMA